VCEQKARTPDPALRILAHAAKEAEWSSSISLPFLLPQLLFFGQGLSGEVTLIQSAAILFFLWLGYQPALLTTTDHAFGPPSLKVMSFKSGRTSNRVGSMDSTFQPLGEGVLDLLP
jgi:hypothetical protein